MALFSGYKENYYEVEGIRLHYVDEGSGKPILMVHGQPTWASAFPINLQTSLSTPCEGMSGISHPWSNI